MGLRMTCALIAPPLGIATLGTTSTAPIAMLATQRGTRVFNAPPKQAVQRVLSSMQQVAVAEAGRTILVKVVVLVDNSTTECLPAMGRLGVRRALSPQTPRPAIQRVAMGSTTTLMGVTALQLSTTSVLLVAQQGMTALPAPFSSQLALAQKRMT